MNELRGARLVSSRFDLGCVLLASRAAHGGLFVRSGAGLIALSVLFVVGSK